MDRVILYGLLHSLAASGAIRGGAKSSDYLFFQYLFKSISTDVVPFLPKHSGIFYSRSLPVKQSKTRGNMVLIGNRSQVAKAEVCKTSIRRFESDRFLKGRPSHDLHQSPFRRKKHLGKAYDSSTEPHWYFGLDDPGSHHLKRKGVGAKRQGADDKYPQTKNWTLTLQ